jgi:hypothetical protein
VRYSSCSSIRGAAAIFPVLESGRSVHWRLAASEASVTSLLNLRSRCGKPRAQSPETGRIGAGSISPDSLSMRLADCESQSSPLRDA